MDTDQLINAVRFYLRRLQRLSRSPDAPLSAAAEAALWEQAELAASRLRRLAEVERVPVSVKRTPSQSRRTR
jgi:hypothetical protein